MKNSHSKGIEESIKSKVSEEAILPIQYTVQTAGELSEHKELHNYCVYLYTNSIEPFLKKHLFTDGTQTSRSVHQNMLLSIIGGSFFEDLEVLLGDIVGSPTFISMGRGSPDLFQNTIEIANTAITSIFTKINNSYSKRDSQIRVAIETGQKGALGITTKDFIEQYKSYKNLQTYTDDFFDYVNIICNFLDMNIIYEDSGFDVRRDQVEPLLNNIIDYYAAEDLPADNEGIWKVLQDYVKYAIDDYIEFGDYEAAAAGAAAEGGSFQIKPRVHRRKTNGSPRRRTLRNSLNYK
jgi:hypothetical protein